jgi:hypothetical protein
MKSLSIILYCDNRNLSSLPCRRVAGGCMFDIQVEVAWRAHHPATEDLQLDATGSVLAIPM